LPTGAGILPSTVCIDRKIIIVIQITLKLKYCGVHIKKNNIMDLALAMGYHYILRNNQENWLCILLYHIVM
jgi:hypothetical protein